MIDATVQIKWINHTQAVEVYHRLIDCGVSVSKQTFWPEESSLRARCVWDAETNMLDTIFVLKLVFPALVIHVKYLKGDNMCRRVF